MLTRRVNLRQIEAFKAVMEGGNVSRGAELLNVTQPAMSKLIAHLEFDIGLQLFDRVKKRLVPTEHATRLYAEIDRIFSGVRQVESAIDALRREEQGRVVVGVAPALSGSFIKRVTTNFLKQRQNVFCCVRSLHSDVILERLLVRQLDIGLINGFVATPHVTLIPLMEHPLVCAMPPDHPLASRKRIELQDLEATPFIGFDAEVYIGRLIDDMLQTHGVRPNVTVTATSAMTVCEFAAAGLGATLLHPLMMAGYEKQLVVRPFLPEINYNVQLCRSMDNKHARLVDLYENEIRAAAAQMSERLFEAFPA